MRSALAQAEGLCHQALQLRVAQRGFAATSFGVLSEFGKSGLLFQTQQNHSGENAMDQFIARFKNEISGAVSGFDRLVFRATPSRLMYSKGMEEYLWQSKVLFKDYEQHVKKIRERLRKASLSEYQKLGLPVVYVRSSDIDKEALAREIAAERKILSGPVCALKCLEPSPTFEHRGKSMVSRIRPCLVIYHYCLDPEYGWMNARIQTWFPF